MIKSPVSNRFAVLGDMEEAHSHRKHMLSSQYVAIASLLESCMQLEEEGKVQGVLQEQVNTIKLLQKGELPDTTQNNPMLSRVNCIDTKLDHLLTSYGALQKAITSPPPPNPSYSSPVGHSASPSAQIMTGPKTYAEATSHGCPPSPTFKTANVEKEVGKRVGKSEKRQRLVVKIQKDAMQNFNGLQLRNLINDAFSMHNITDKAVVAGVFPSFSGQSLIITAMSEFSSDFLLQHHTIWQEAFSQVINSDLSFEKDEKWGKFVLHDIPTEIFNCDDGMALLKTELEEFNPGLILKKNPIWLTSWEKRDASQTASVLVFVENMQQASRTHVLVSSLQLRVYEYKEKDPKTFLQCFNCQKWGHSARDCLRKTVCQLCAEAHYTKGHTCSICKKMGAPCSHTNLKCGNCGEKHAANNMECSFFPRRDKSNKTLGTTEKRKYQEMDCVLIPVAAPQQLQDICPPEEPVKRKMKKSKTQC